MVVRNFIIDNVKFILIILVIFGHIPLIRGFINYGVESIELDLITWNVVKGIYAFHMPLFVFISGYFSKDKSIYDTLISSKKILKLFILFQYFGK